MLIFQHTYEMLPLAFRCLQLFCKQTNIPRVQWLLDYLREEDGFIVKFTGHRPKSSEPAGISRMSLNKPFSPQATTTPNPQNTAGILWPVCSIFTATSPGHFQSSLGTCAESKAWSQTHHHCPPNPALPGVIGIYPEDLTSSPLASPAAAKALSSALT